MATWTPEGLPAAVGLAQDALDARIAAQLPSCSARWQRRTRALSPGGDRAAYFLHPAAFPTLALPHWLAPAAPPELHAALLRSSLAGYWAIRIVDQITDGDDPEDRQLATVLSLLHAEFWAPYRARMPPEQTALWRQLEGWWWASADAAVAEQQASPDQLRALGRAKTGAVHIPLLALHGGPTLPASWTALVARLCDVHQLHNDWTDWRRDRAAGQRTWAQLWAETQAGERDPAAWWALRGAEAFATQVLQPELRALRDQFETLGASGGVHWCDARGALIENQRDRLQSATAALRALLGQT